MNLRNTILRGQSKSMCEKIVAWIGDNQNRFDELVELFLHDEPVIAQRAGWPMSESAISYPHLAQKHLRGIIYKVKQPGQHEAIARNATRLLQFCNIPEELHGEIMDMCFNYIASPQAKPAVKAFSLTILQKLARQYPDIQSELVSTIEDRWPFETPAFHSRAKKILSEFR